MKIYDKNIVKNSHIDTELFIKRSSTMSPLSVLGNKSNLQLKYAKYCDLFSNTFSTTKEGRNKEEEEEEEAVPHAGDKYFCEATLNCIISCCLAKS